MGEIKKVKKIFNLEAANADLKKRQDIYKKTDDGITGLFNSINNNFNTMSITIPEDKKKGLAKEIKAVEEKLGVLKRFKGTVGKIEELVAALTDFDNSLKSLDSWKDSATAELKDIKEASGGMLPEDRVARTMDLQEDIAAKLEILKANAARELDLLPQGDKVPADAQAFKDELKRNGSCWTTPSPSSTPGWPRTSPRRARTSSLWRRWSPPWASSRTSSSRRRNWLRTYKKINSLTAYVRVLLRHIRDVACFVP